MTRFRLFVEQASDAFYLHDASGRFVNVNEAACQMLGYRREELRNFFTCLRRAFG